MRQIPNIPKIDKYVQYGRNRTYIIREVIITGQDTGIVAKLRINGADILIRYEYSQMYKEYLIEYEIIGEDLTLLHLFQVEHYVEYYMCKLASEELARLAGLEILKTLKVP